MILKRYLIKILGKNDPSINALNNKSNFTKSKSP
jgi:hypothetical protein